MTAVLLIQVALKACLVLAAAWAVTAAMRRGSAASRHLVWTIGIAATLALPLVRVAGPTWTVSLPESAWSTVAASSVDRALTSSPIEDDALLSAQTAVITDSAAPSRDAAQPVGPLAPSIGHWALSLEPWMKPWVALGAVWLLGAALFLLRLAYGLERARRITQGATPVTDEGWLASFDEAAAALRVEGRVLLRQTDQTAVPVACGLWRPAVLLPADALTWSAERRVVVLLHELAHVRRRDCLVQAMAQLTCALHWMNPLAHVAVARLRAEQERACDDLVLSAGTDAPVYADHLFEIARAFRAPGAPAWATLAMARPSQLEGRLMAILDDRCNRAPLAGRMRMTIGMGAATALVALGALHLTPHVAASAVDTEVAVSEVAVSDSTRTPPNAVPAASASSRSDEAPVADAAQQPPPAPTAPAAPPQAPQMTAPVSDETRRRVADALSSALSDENEEVREQALNGLASMRDARAIPALLKALRDPSPDLREHAVNGLAQFDTQEALDGLVSALKDSSPDVREHAIRHVGAKIGRGRISADQYIDVMMTLARDQEPDIREAAAQALGQSRSVRALPALIALLKDAEKDVREHAAQALGNIGDPGAIDALTAALKDADPEVRENAAMALARIARGERRGPMRLVPPTPVPPVPPVRPIVSVDIDPQAIEVITRTALEQTARALGVTIDQINNTTDAELRRRFERSVEQQVETAIQSLRRR